MNYYDNNYQYEGRIQDLQKEEESLTREVRVLKAQMNNILDQERYKLEIENKVKQLSIEGTSIWTPEII